VFNGNFNDFSTHPLIKQCAPINGNRICSTAAGAYQMLDKSWWDLQPKLKLADFSPVSQDRMAVEYIRRNNAIKDVESGNFDKAACKVGKIWASFPCNSYNQNSKSMRELSKYYQQQLLSLGG
jgi:muramidase (phage lysozyme)